MVQVAEATESLPSLPHWEQPPADIPAAVREVKAAIRRRIGAAGRSVEEVVAVLEATITDRIDEIVGERRGGASVWPVLDYDDIAAGRVPPDTVARLRRRGCVVVRGHFPRADAVAWDRSVVDYVEANRFFESYRGPGDDFFATVDAKPEIYPIYWSRAQMEARQSGRMQTVQAFLNRLWTSPEDPAEAFDPDRNLMYPDRIRRRPPGTTSAGLGPHLDPGNLDLWMTSGNQRAFRHLFDGSVEDYDPWDASHRTSGPQYPGTTTCSAFRTFQGWTALSDMGHDQGVLHTVPIPEALAYLMLRPLLADIAEDDMCGVRPSRTFPVTRAWHPLLDDALCGVPDIEAGDSVWWHCDMVHAVAPVEDQVGWGNVMYIPAAPWCPRNERYAPVVAEALRSGDSPDDFPAEHYERGWTDRFGVEDLSPLGRRQLGLGAPRP